MNGNGKAGLGEGATKALVALYREERGEDRSIFPGALGRSGVVLVRRGLVRRLGVETYRGGRHELAHRYTRYTLTDEGRRIAAELAKH